MNFRVGKTLGSESGNSRNPDLFRNGTSCYRSIGWLLAMLCMWDELRQDLDCLIDLFFRRSFPQGKADERIGRVALHAYRDHHMRWLQRSRRARGPARGANALQIQSGEQRNAVAAANGNRDGVRQ